MDSWSDRIEMVKTAPLAFTSPSEKMPFEVTPFFPFLKHFAGEGSGVTTRSSARNRQRTSLREHCAQLQAPGAFDQYRCPFQWNSTQRRKLTIKLPLEKPRP